MHGARELSSSAHYPLPLTRCRLAEGRQPWGTAAGAAGAAPALQMGGGGGGVWSAAASDSGRLVATGGDDGVVSLWDVCSGACAWQVGHDDIDIYCV